MADQMQLYDTSAPTGAPRWTGRNDTWMPSPWYGVRSVSGQAEILCATGV